MKLFVLIVVIVAGALIVPDLVKQHRCGAFLESESWRGKVVVVTGASSGIGADLARVYASLGAHVVLAARRQDLLAAIAAESTQLGAASVLTVAVDLGVVADCQKLVDETRARHGSALHALILNHAISDNQLLLEFADGADTAQRVAEHYERVMRINWLSLPVLIRLAFPALQASRGHVSLISSGSTLFPVPFHPAYISSKFAMNGLLGSLHEEFAAVGVRDQVTMGVVIVGLVATPMVSYFNASILERTAMPSHACAQGIACTVHLREEYAYVPGWIGWILPVTRLLPASVRSHMAAMNFIDLVPDFLARIADVKEKISN